MHFSRYVDYWARRNGDVTAFRCGAQEISWAGLRDEADKLAATWQANGLVAGDRVACLMESGIDFCVVFAAAIRSKAIFVPLNPAFGAMELQEIQSDCSPRVTVSHDGLIEKLPGTRQTTRRGEIVMAYQDIARSDRLGAGDFIAANGKSGENLLDLMAISYTSGTTGIPKGAMLTHAAVDAMVTGMSSCLGWRGNLRILIAAPMAYTGGFICNVAPVFKLGGYGEIMRKFDPEQALKIIAAKDVNHLATVPTLWQRLADIPRFQQTDIAHLGANAGGAPVPDWLLHEYAEKDVIIRQMYGCTEGCGASTCATKESAIAAPWVAGYSLPGTDLQIQDAAGKAVIGEVGEICLGGPQIMKGYWNKQEATSIAFRDGWYLTGDLGRVDSDGALTVVDRKKNMVISGGVNIYPAEVERKIAGIRGVSEIAAFGLPSRVWGEELVALVYAPGLNQSEIMTQARDLLGPIKTPKRIVLSPTPLPRTHSNKIARTSLGDTFSQLIEQASGH
jgi:fatty-acyl-CoA synthase